MSDIFSCNVHTECAHCWRMVRQKTTFDSVASLKLGFRRAEAAVAVGSGQLLDDMCRAGWLKPVVDRHKLQLFDRGDILRAWSRILAGEIPPIRNRRAGKQISKHTAIAPAVAESVERNGGPVCD